MDMLGLQLVMPCYGGVNTDYIYVFHPFPFSDTQKPCAFCVFSDTFDEPLHASQERIVDTRLQFDNRLKDIANSACKFDHA